MKSPERSHERVGAIDFAHALADAEQNVAILAAAETFSSEMPSTGAAALKASNRGRSSGRARRSSDLRQRDQSPGRVDREDSSPVAGQADILPGPLGVQARRAGPRGAAGGVGAAGLIRHPRPPARGGVRRAGDAAVHQGPAAAGAGQPRGADTGGPAGPGAGYHRCRRGAADPRARPGAVGGLVQPGPPTPTEAGGRAGARPDRLQQSDGGVAL